MIWAWIILAVVAYCVAIFVTAVELAPRMPANREWSQAELALMTAVVWPVTLPALLVRALWRTIVRLVGQMAGTERGPRIDAR